jgi:hypothetical protein
MGLPVTVEQHGGAYTLTVHVPPRRNGEPNHGAMGRACSLLATVVPSAFDPEPRPVVPHEVATAAQRDGVLLVEGDEIPGAYRCANGACSGD